MKRSFNQKLLGRSYMYRSPTQRIRIDLRSSSVEFIEELLNDGIWIPHTVGHYDVKSPIEMLSVESAHSLGECLGSLLARVDAGERWADDA